MNNDEFEKSIEDLPVGWVNYLIKARKISSEYKVPKNPKPGEEMATWEGKKMSVNDFNRHSLARYKLGEKMGLFPNTPSNEEHG